MKKVMFLFLVIMFALIVIRVYTRSMYLPVEDDEYIRERVDAIAAVPSHEVWIITDIHYLSDRLSDNGSLITEIVIDGDGKNLFILDELMDGLLKEIVQKGPDALIITGDLTFNGAKKSHIDLAKWLGRIESAGTDVFVIPGNHDIESPMARSYKGERSVKADNTSASEFSSIYNEFGYGQAISRDSASLSYLVEPFAGFQILMLDSCIYENNMANHYSECSGRISEETRGWIEECLSTSREKGQEIIAAMHHSLMDHSDTFCSGYTIEDSELLCRFFSQLGITSFFTGHTHFQDIVEKNYSTCPIEDISTNAFSVYPHNFGVIKNDGNGWYYTVGSILDGGELFDEDFISSARLFFIDTCNRMINSEC